MHASPRAAVLVLLALALSLAGGWRAARLRSGQAQAVAVTPIQHLVVIALQGASFDHYFGTYPTAANPPGEPAFMPVPNTRLVDGLTPSLLNANPNLDPPFRLDRAQAYTCAQSSRYGDEQRAYDAGAVDRFVQSTAQGPSNPDMYCPLDRQGRAETVMGYFDGNTVTALWNYAQHFASSDEAFGTTYGQPALGLLHLVAGDTSGVVCGPPAAVYGNQPPCGAPGDAGPESTASPAPANGSTGTLVLEGEPFWDACTASDASARAALSGLTIGDLLDGAGVSWGWFQGGFAPSADGTCDVAHVQEAYDAVAGIDPGADLDAMDDYSAALEPFQYFASTANPGHVPPDSAETVGHDDAANHQYDLSWLWQAAAAGNLPAVSFVEPPAYQAGAAGRSNPLDEQQFLVETVNQLQHLPEWSSMAIVLTWTDSGGWYDHVAPRIVNSSHTPLDFACGEVDSGPPGRCAYGPRLPLLVISPYARQNYVSHALLDQTSITRFIEDNWLGGQRLRAQSFDTIAGSLLDLFDFTQPPAPGLTLEPTTGEPAP